jgi:hypothetical protein
VNELDNSSLQETHPENGGSSLIQNIGAVYQTT